MSQTLRVAAFVDKGGVGKTTSIAHLAVPLAEHCETLVIDLAGKQGDLSKQFGVWQDYRTLMRDDDAWPNITTPFSDVWDQVVEEFAAEGRSATEEMIFETGEGPDIIPAHEGLDGLDRELADIDSVSDRYALLDAFITENVEPLGYEAILVDLPGLTNEITYNGLSAVDHVIAPLEMGPFEMGQLRSLRSDIEEMNEQFDTGLELSLIVPNKIDERRKLDRQQLDELAAEDSPVVPVSYSQDIKNSASQGCTAYQLEEPSKTAKRALQSYESASQQLREMVD